MSDPFSCIYSKFLLDFHFPKEAQQIDRVLEAFAFRYHACNPHLFRSAGNTQTAKAKKMIIRHIAGKTNGHASDLVFFVGFLLFIEVVYTIAFSLMLLHTDAHNKNVRYKMTKEQYVRQAKSIDGVNTIPADILEVNKHKSK